MKANLAQLTVQDVKDWVSQPWYADGDEYESIVAKVTVVDQQAVKQITKDTKANPDVAEYLYKLSMTSDNYENRLRIHIQQFNRLNKLKRSNMVDLPYMCEYVLDGRIPVKSMNRTIFKIISSIVVGLLIALLALRLINSWTSILLFVVSFGFIISGWNKITDRKLRITANQYLKNKGLVT